MVHCAEIKRAAVILTVDKLDPTQRVAIERFYEFDFSEYMGAENTESLKSLIEEPLSTELELARLRSQMAGCFSFSGWTLQRDGEDEEFIQLK